MSERESTQERIGDLEQPDVTKEAEQVKGGASATTTSTSVSSTPLLKVTSPKLIIPCI